MGFSTSNSINWIFFSIFGCVSIGNPIFGGQTCVFPAVFNFGDSNSDTGGWAATFIPPQLPYGETYFYGPVGRFSDGRFIVDFIAQNFGIPYLSAYLNSLATNYTNGANFATASSTITIPATVQPNSGGLSPFSLDVQYLHFLQFTNRSQAIKQAGGRYAEEMPPKEYFEEALYTIDIGQNDLGAQFFTNQTTEQLIASIPEMLSVFSRNVKNIYDLGGRAFWIHNTGPIGCLPYILTPFSSATKDNAGCLTAYNEVAQQFNAKLNDTVIQLRKELLSAVFIYVDVYSVKYSLFSDPKRYGFELPLVSCCGFGGPYNYSGAVTCGYPSTLTNPTQVIIDSACDNPSVRVVWDGVHYTEAANKFIFDKIATGAFSDPPVPLNSACHRSATA